MTHHQRLARQTTVEACEALLEIGPLLDARSDGGPDELPGGHTHSAGREAH